MEKNELNFSPVLFACLFLAHYGDGKATQDEGLALQAVAEAIFPDDWKVVLKTSVDSFYAMSIEEQAEAVTSYANRAMTFSNSDRVALATYVSYVARADGKISKNEKEILRWFGV